ncbi:MAG: mandelate racemase/muconate lactonizing enzyme family protein [Acidimicrobiia bacterium]
MCLCADRVTVTEVRTLPLAPQPVTTSTILPRWASALFTTGNRARWREHERRFLLELVAADGTAGRYGACSAAVVEVVRDQLAPRLIGSDPRAVRVLERAPVGGRHRQGSHFQLATSAVELALWDLRSRLGGETVGALLGGALRTEIPLYASALGLDIDHPAAPDLARWLAGEGFHGQKWALPGHGRGEEPSRDIDRLERLREAVGPEHPIMVDAHGTWSVDYARRLLPSLRDLALAWVEEPLHPGNPGLSRLRRENPGVAFAGGEHAYDPELQLAAVMSGDLDVWQPEVSWHGGLAPSLRMADIAAWRGLRTFPHGAFLDGALNLAAAVEPSVIPAVEYHLTLESARQSLFTEARVPRRGAMEVRREPGLTPPYAVPASSTPCLLAQG